MDNHVMVRLFQRFYHFVAMPSRPSSLILN